MWSPWGLCYWLPCRDRAMDAKRDLWEASRSGDINGVRKAVEAGADVNAIDEDAVYKKAALHYASRWVLLSCVCGVLSSIQDPVTSSHVHCKLQLSTHAHTLESACVQGTFGMQCQQLAWIVWCSLTMYHDWVIVAKEWSLGEACQLYMCRHKHFAGLCVHS